VVGDIYFNPMTFFFKSRFLTGEFWNLYPVDVKEDSSSFNIDTKLSECSELVQDLMSLTNSLGSTTNNSSDITEFSTCVVSCIKMITESYSLLNNIIASKFHLPPGSAELHHVLPCHRL